MSQNEAFKGKLKEFVRGRQETFSKYVLRFIKFKKQEIPLCYSQKDIVDENAEEMFKEIFYKEVGVIVDNVIYEIINIINLEEGDIFDVRRQSDGTIDFILRYYNGGCSFTEAMEEAFQKME